MKKTLIKELPYDAVDFRWISNHYDVHLNGTCMLDGELCEFEGELPAYNDERDEWEEMIVRVYRIDRMSRIRWRLRQWLFEQCVGYHCTYPHRRQGHPLYYRRPVWLYKKLHKMYYKIKKLLK